MMCAVLVVVNIYTTHFWDNAAYCRVIRWTGSTMSDESQASTFKDQILYAYYNKLFYDCVFNYTCVAPILCFPTTIPQYHTVQQNIGKVSVTNRAVNKQKLSSNAKYATLNAKYRRYLYWQLEISVRYQLRFWFWRGSNLLKVQWSEVKWSEVKWGEVWWCEVKWSGRKFKWG